ITVPAAGRQLDVLATGPPDARTVLLHDGTPAGLLAAPSFVARAAAERGLRLVQYNRPGYGGSPPDPRPPGAGAAGGGAAGAGGVAAVLEALGGAEFRPVGWSGGGPHALACAAGLPGRCLAAASMAGVAPYRAEGLDWLHGMAGENVAEFSAALAGAEALTAFLEP